MEQRINLQETGQAAFKAMYGLTVYLNKSHIEKSLLHLIEYRVSQINGCAYCLDMHSKDMRVAGESEQRIYLVSAWRESPFYTSRECAALAWAEAVTTLPNREVPDDVYEMARKEFTEAELMDLTIVVITINSYNRINIAFRVKAGGYEPGMHDPKH